MAAPQKPSPGVRPAATVVVLRPTPVGPTELYMVQRSSKSAFMPNTLVFPGGRVESEDGRREDEAFARAAQRECQEETGLDVEGRELAWFDTWQTPSGESSRRFLARFYLARLEAGEGTAAAADGEETFHGRWASAAAHLDGWKRGDVDLPPPTLAILLGLRDFPERLFGRQDPELRTPILPKLAAASVDGRNTVEVVLPHDPGYANLDGEGANCPQRALDYPTRFVRDGNRWRPRT